MTASNQKSEAAFVLPRGDRLPILERIPAPKMRIGQQPRSSPWLTVKEAATRARCGVKLIYREVKAERLQAAKVGGRKELRFRAEWIDDWLQAHRVIK